MHWFLFAEVHHSDWEYFEINPHCAAELAHVEGDLYELIIIVSSSSRCNAGISTAPWTEKTNARITNHQFNLQWRGCLCYEWFAPEAPHETWFLENLWTCRRSNYISQRTESMKTLIPTCSFLNYIQINAGPIGTKKFIIKVWPLSCAQSRLCQDTLPFEPPSCSEELRWIWAFSCFQHTKTTHANPATRRLV